MPKIIHIDMDAFFASIEQRDNPNYQGKPVVVGGTVDSRGVVAAASYEARKFGIKSAMSCYQAHKLCPEAIFVKPRFDAYRAVSQQIHAIFHKVTPIVEPLSLDEAYLDVSDCPLFGGRATLIAHHLKREIYDTTGLTASAGVSFNKMLAKIASDINKPDGITIITYEEAAQFIDNLTIDKFFGIGKSTARKLQAMGIHTGFDLKNADVTMLTRHFGKRGQFYYDIAHLKDERQVEPTRTRKSVGSETTFHHDSSDDTALLAAIFLQCDDALAQLNKRQLQAHTITLKIKYSNFQQITRSYTQSHAFDQQSSRLALQRLFGEVPRSKAIRLVGVSFAKLSQNESQLDLFL